MSFVTAATVAWLGVSPVAVTRTVAVGLLVLRDQAFRHDHGETSPVVDALAERLQRGP